MGLRTRVIFPTFQMLGMLLIFCERLKMLVRALTACGRGALGGGRICRHGLWSVRFLCF